VAGDGDWARARRGLKVSAAAPKPKVFQGVATGNGCVHTEVFVTLGVARRGVFSAMLTIRFGTITE